MMLCRASIRIYLVLFSSTPDIVKVMFMDDILKGYMSTIISLILFSLLLSFIVYLAVSTNDLRNIKDAKVQLSQEMQDYRQLYFYNNRTLTGDDVLLAVKKYTGVYNMSIQTMNGGRITLLTSDPESWWSLDNVRRLMGDSVYRHYVSNLVIDEYGVITGMSFDLKN